MLFLKERRAEATIYKKDSERLKNGERTHQSEILFREEIGEHDSHHRVNQL